MLCGAAAAGADQKPPPGPKGRFLVVSPGFDLESYRGFLAVIEPLRLEADKDKPKANQKLVDFSEKRLVKALKKAKLFRAVRSYAPGRKDADLRILRVETELTLDTGSRVTRRVVGEVAMETGLPLGLTGAGKGRLHMQVEFVDPESAEVVAFYNGYGNAGGIGKAAKKARGAVHTNCRKLGKLLKKELEGPSKGEKKSRRKEAEEE